MRHTGIPVIGDVPWGTHFCQFYHDPQDLIDILVPYFKAGLENNEFCMWVTSEPLGVEAAKAALSREVGDLEQYVRNGQIDIIDHTQWYTAGGRFESDRVLQGWVERHDAARSRGFDGLRLTGNTFWLEKPDWRDFAEYEAAVDGVIGRYRMLAICTYSLARCGAAEIMDVVANHAFALIKRAGEWQIIESAERKRLEASLRASEESYSLLFERMTEGFALHEIVCDGQGRPCDYRFLEINSAFERLTGLKRADVIGKTMRQVLPNADPEWIEMYGRVALTGEAICFDQYSQQLQRHYEVRAFRPAPRQLAVLLTDVTERKHAELALRESEARQAVAKALETQRYRLHEILEKLPVMVCLIAPDYQVPFANRMFRETFGDPLGRTCFNYIFNLAEPCPQCESLVPLRTGLPHRWVNPCPGDRLIEAYDFPFTDVDGSPMILEVDVDITERKRMEEELRTASLYARSLIEASLDPLVTISPEGKITDVNEATERVTGVPRERLIGSSFSDYFTEPRKAEEGYHKVLAESSVHDYPLTIRRADGHTTDVLYNATLYRNQAGEVQGVFAAARDITERKRMEEELRAASFYARSLIEANLDPLMTVSPEGRVTDVNQATEQVTGVPRHRLIGSEVFDHFTEPERARAGLGKVLSEGLVRDYPMTIRHAGGRTTDVVYNATVYRNQAGEVQGVFAAARDITERKRMEEELRAASLYARSLIEASLDPLVTISPEGRITDVNLATEMVTGAPRDRLIGSDFSDYFTEPDRARAGYRKVLSEGLVRDYPLTIRHADGYTTDVLYHATVYRDEGGAVQGVFAAARDVTERKRAEAELARYRDHLEDLVRQRTGELEDANAHLQRTGVELARSNQELEHFAYVASHDLQEPLRAVTGYLGLIEKQLGNQLDDKCRHYMEGAAQGGARMHRLITDLLALSRVGTRGQIFEAASLDAALDQALEGLRASIHETGAKITRDPLPTLPVDAFQMIQLFQNLVGNALKFRSQRPPEIHVGARQEPDQWVVSVSDNGIGVEPQYFERIFLVFQRLHTRSQYPGTGIGLAICRKIVERHGGTMWIESQAGQGSTFYFTIPQARIA